MGGANTQIQAAIGGAMCLSLLSGQLAVEVCPHIQEPLWLVELAVVGLLILAWPWAMTQEAVSLATGK